MANQPTKSLLVPDPNRVALLQTCATDDVEANLNQTQRLFHRAVEQGAGTVLVPEAFAFIGRHGDKLAMAEPLPAGGPVLKRCADLAANAGVHLLLGGFHEQLPRTDRTDKTANTFVHLNDRGEVAASYRKIHLFDVDLPDGTRLAESSNTEPGSQCVTSDLPFGRLGLTICYDLRFPALFASLRAKDCVAIAVPSAFTATTGAAHWHALLKARAIETQCYVLAAAQYGAHNPKRRSYGHSLIIDPWGEILAEGPADEEAVISATIDLARLAQVRRQLPCADHQRAFSV